MGNPLELLSKLVDFEMFRPSLEDGLIKKECKNPTGHPRSRQQRVLFHTMKIIEREPFVEAPMQRNTKEENKQIKAGQGKDL